MTENLLDAHAHIYVGKEREREREINGFHNMLIVGTSNPTMLPYNAHRHISEDAFIFISVGTSDLYVVTKSPSTNYVMP